MSGLLGGVLPAIYSASDRLKRSVNGLLDDPRSWLESKGQTIATDAAAARSLLADAVNEDLTNRRMTYGPANQRAAMAIADAYNVGGMTVNYPRAEALETARKKAVKMLGLPENNTPMDRARAMGFDADAFHATPYDFDSLRVNPYRGSVFLAPTPSGAATGARAGAGDAMGGRPTTERILPVMVRSDDIKGLSLTKDEAGWFKSLPDSMPESAVDLAMKDAPRGTYWFQWLDEAQTPSGEYVYRKKPMPSIRYADAAKSRRDVYGGEVGHYSTASDERWSAENAAKLGKKGFLLQDESGMALAITDPSAVRSRFAAFDPARINENDLLGRADPFLLGLLGVGTGGAAYLTSDKKAEK